MLMQILMEERILQKQNDISKDQINLPSNNKVNEIEDALVVWIDIYKYHT